MNAKLTLIPTPINDDLPLCQVATELLRAAVENGDNILVEEHKIARRRWLSYGLPREAIENFIIYNEHTYDEVSKEVLADLKAGKNAFLMSDCGLPAFCDPGRRIVEACHKAHIKVTASPFANSIALAISLSGFPHDRFIFEGFIPIKSADRSLAIKRIVKNPMMSIVMDTPYRINRIIEEFEKVDGTREVFLAMDLNCEKEELRRGSLSHLSKSLKEQKREFVLIIGPLPPKEEKSERK